MEETHAKWLDLPQLPAELILERLPLSDYIRFAAVCQQWRLIQTEHRRFHTPSPPPMLPLPWLLPSEQEQDSQETLCFSPFEERFYRLLLPNARGKRCCCSSHGWLLLLEASKLELQSKLYGYLRDYSVIPDRFFSKQLTLLNPISGVEIQLPPLNQFQEPFLGAISSPPTDPNCVIMVSNADQIFLCRVGDHHWTTVSLPVPTMPTEFMDYISSAIFCGGKFYCIFFDGRFIGIDPLPTPAMQSLEMDGSQLPSDTCFNVLVESNGEVLLVVALYEDKGFLDLYVKGFQVFKADLSKMMWVRMGSLGDRVLILGHGCSASLLAADVGGRGNCMYYPQPLSRFRIDRHTHGCWIPWKRFDLRTARVIDGPLPNTTPEYDCSQLRKHALCWLIPSLDCIPPAATSSIGRVSDCSTN